MATLEELQAQKAQLQAKLADDTTTAATRKAIMGDAQRALNDATNSHNSALAAIAADEQQLVDVQKLIDEWTPTPPSTGKVLLGSSAGGSTATAVADTLKQMPKAHILRIYSSGAPTTVAAEDAFAAAVAAMKKVGGEVWYSFKSKPSDATFITLLADWAKQGIKIRWCYNHEPDNPSKNIVPATFVADFEHLIAVANAHPSPNVEEYSCFMAYMLDPASGRNPESWYVKSARTLGFDCYVLKNYDRIVAYAKTKGKPFILPEWGGGGKDDAKALTFSQAMVARWQANPPQGAAWFNADGTGASTYLKNIPKTAAYLNTLT